MSDEIRTTSSTGGQKGVKDERHDLLPREGIEAIARVFAFGATKYADHNWRKGYEWGKSYAALQRHLMAFWSGETYDEESGLPHLAHAGFHVLVLLTWLEQDGEGSQFDDRYRPAAEEPKDRLVVGPGQIYVAPVDPTPVNGYGNPGPFGGAAAMQFIGTLADQALSVTNAYDDEDPYAWPEAAEQVLRDGLTESVSMEIPLSEVSLETFRTIFGDYASELARMTEVPKHHIYYDPEDDIRAVRAWWSEQMVDLMGPSTRPGTDLGPAAEVDIDAGLGDLSSDDVSDIEARFTSGPYGTEDREADMMTVTYQDAGPDLLSKHRAPIQMVMMESDGLGGEIPRLIEDETRAALQRSMNRQRGW